MTNDELEDAMEPKSVRVATGFRAYAPDSDMGEIINGEGKRVRWTLTGCLPSDGPMGSVSHYDMEDAIIKAGLIERRDCDSESGQFFVYPPTEEACRAIGAWIQERLDREPANPLA